jgi:hypothetical protein
MRRTRTGWPLFTSYACNHDIPPDDSLFRLAGGQVAIPNEWLAISEFSKTCAPARALRSSLKARGGFFLRGPACESLGIRTLGELRMTFRVLVEATKCVFASWRSRSLSHRIGCNIDSRDDPVGKRTFTGENLLSTLSIHTQGRML